MTKTQVEFTAKRHEALSKLAWQETEPLGGMNPTSDAGVDEEIYAKFKPLFIAAARKFPEVKDDIAELMGCVIGDMVANHGCDPETIERMRPYVQRFIKEYEEDKVDLDAEVESAAPKTPVAAQGPTASRPTGEIHEPVSVPIHTEATSGEWTAEKFNSATEIRGDQGEASDQSQALAPLVRKAVIKLLGKGRQPSAWELLEHVEREFGLKARWVIRPVLRALTHENKELQGLNRSYLTSLLQEDDLAKAFEGAHAPRKEIASEIDSLLRQSAIYRSSEKFAEIVSFMAKFRNYSPYNNMLVRLQNPSCGYYATAKDWMGRFDRTLKEDARPMLILAPKHPVMLVFDLDQTEGPPLPADIREFAHFEGEWNGKWLERTIENAGRRDAIRVHLKTLSSINAGFATIVRGSDAWKMGIGLSDALDEPSQFGVLCHELAHIYLGHLGSDSDYWWPSRENLDHHTMEIEAEAVAFVVTARRGLGGASPTYVSRHRR